MLGEVEGSHLSIGDGLAGPVGPVMERGADGQAGRGGRALEVPKHGVPGGEGMAGPGLADRAEEAVLDRVPLRAAGRVVADGDRQAVAVAELLLELLLPDPRAGTVAAAAVGQDQQLARLGIRGPALVGPPAS